MLLHPFQKSCLLQDGFVLWEIQTTKYVSLVFFFSCKKYQFPCKESHCSSKHFIAWTGGFLLVLSQHFPSKCHSGKAAFFYSKSL